MHWECCHIWELSNYQIEHAAVLTACSVCSLYSRDITSTVQSREVTWGMIRSSAKFRLNLSYLVVVVLVGIFLPFFVLFLYTCWLRTIIISGIEKWKMNVKIVHFLFCLLFVVVAVLRKHYEWQDSRISEILSW